MRPKALILLATGTNRDLDVAEALTLAGAEAEIVPLNRLRSGEKRWGEYQMLVLPGGFSYADALGAGKLLAIDLRTYFTEEIQKFVESGKPVIGICNGFQALVKAGILPGNGEEQATLTFNASGHFECRWVRLKPVSEKCLWTNGLTETVECPVAHGEGNFQTASGKIAAEHIALAYVRADGLVAKGQYPENPNGSLLDIAGITNQQGNVLGLMPHPENHVHGWQHPQWRRGAKGGSGLALFKNGVEACRQV